MKSRHPTFLQLALVAIGLLVSRATVEAQVLPPDTLVLREADNGTTANAVIGQSISVELHGNLTTGYEWMLAETTGDSILTNGGVVYTVDPGGGVGVGGTFIFPFLAAKVGDTALAFENRRPSGGPSAQSFDLTIHVTTQPPRLSITLVKANVVISWPIATSTNFFLEGASSLNPAQWAALNALPLPDGTNFIVNLGTGGKALYFRLRHL